MPQLTLHYPPPVKTAHRLDFLYQKRSKINDEIRMLKKSIDFFENILLFDSYEIPELTQFKQRLNQAIRARKRINLDLAVCSENSNSR